MKRRSLCRFLLYSWWVNRLYHEWAVVFEGGLVSLITAATGAGLRRKRCVAQRYRWPCPQPLTGAMRNTYNVVAKYRNYYIEAS